MKIYVAISFAFNVPTVTQEEVKEWIEYRLGIRGDMSGSNPLVDKELNDLGITKNDYSIKVK